MESSRMLNRPVEPQPVKKIRPPFFNDRTRPSLISSARPDVDKFAVFADHVVVHVKKQLERGGNVLFRHFAQIGRDADAKIR